MIIYNFRLEFEPDVSSLHSTKCIWGYYRTFQNKIKIALKGFRPEGGDSEGGRLKLKNIGL